MRAIMIQTKKKPSDKGKAYQPSKPAHRPPKFTNGHAADHGYNTENHSFSSAGPADAYRARESPQGIPDFFAPIPQSQQSDGDFERLERQALRRRKVEALESLAHTAALFLAEFMAHTKQKPLAPSLAGLGEPGGAVPAEPPQNHGVNYATAAAGVAVRTERFAFILSIFLFFQ